MHRSSVHPRAAPPPPPRAGGTVEQGLSRLAGLAPLMSGLISGMGPDIALGKADRSELLLWP